MKRISAILFVFLLPLSLFAMDKLPESYLSDFTTDDSLNITKGNDSSSSRSFWTQYLNDPSNIDSLSNEDSSDTTGTKATGTLQGSQFKLPDFTATTTVVDTNDPYNAGMSRIEFPSGLIRTNEGSTSVEVWLGGLANEKNAGKMCDFYSNQIRSHTLPNSTINISTH
jgi:hypothetical protein